MWQVAEAEIAIQGNEVSMFGSETFQALGEPTKSSTICLCQVVTQIKHKLNQQKA